MKIDFPAEMIGKKTNTTKILTMVVVAVVCVSMIAYVWASGLDHTMLSYMVLNSLGYIGLLGVGIASFTSKSVQTYAPTGTPLVCRTVEFSASDYDRVQALVEQGAVGELLKIRRGEGVRMKLEMACAKDKSFAAYQYFQYVSYEYAPASEVRYVAPNVVAQFCS